MTTDGRRWDATAANGRALLLALSLVVGVAVGAGTAVAGAGAGATDGETTIEVTLPEVPDGLSGYQLTLEVDAGTVTGASYPDAFQPTTEPSIADDGRSVSLEAADVSNAVRPGDGEVVLATVSVADPGERPSVRVTDGAIDADGGDRIDPETVRVTVEGVDGTDLRTDVDDGGDSADGGPTDGGETTAADGPGFGALVAVGCLAGIGVLLRRR